MGGVLVGAVGGGGGGRQLLACPPADTASAVGSLFGAERHPLSPLVSSSVMNTCTKGHRNEIYIYNNHNYYSFTNFLFRGWSLAETTEQAKLLKQKVMVPPGRIKSVLQTSRCC